MLLIYHRHHAASRNPSFSLTKNHSLALKIWSSFVLCVSLIQYNLMLSWDIYWIIIHFKSILLTTSMLNIIRIALINYPNFLLKNPFFQDAVPIWNWTENDKFISSKVFLNKWGDIPELLLEILWINLCAADVDVVILYHQYLKIKKIGEI